jgi:hypothetical protein
VLSEAVLLISAKRKMSIRGFHEVKLYCAVWCVLLYGGWSSLMSSVMSCPR